MNEPEMIPPERFAYSVDEVARMCSISRSKVYELISTGEIRSRKIGRRRLVLKAEVERFLGDIDPG